MGTQVETAFIRTVPHQCLEAGWALCLCIFPGACNDWLHSPCAHMEKRPWRVNCLHSSIFFTWDFKVTFTCPKYELLPILKAQFSDQAKLCWRTTVKHPLTSGSNSMNSWSLFYGTMLKPFSWSINNPIGVYTQKQRETHIKWENTARQKKWKDVTWSKVSAWRWTYKMWKRRKNDRKMQKDRKKNKGRKKES